MNAEFQSKHFGNGYHNSGLNAFGFSNHQVQREQEKNDDWLTRFYFCVYDKLNTLLWVLRSTSELPEVETYPFTVHLKSFAPLCTKCAQTSPGTSAECLVFNVSWIAFFLFQFFKNLARKYFWNIKEESCDKDWQTTKNGRKMRALSPRARSLRPAVVTGSN